MPSTRLLPLLSAALIAILITTGWVAYDRPTWLMEVFPIFIVLPLMLATRQRFPLTTLLYALIFAHALVLIVGGTYTYARVPLGFQIQDLLGLTRNPYDKIGHFMQGFVPAIAAREILIRGKHLQPGKMLNFLVICVVLAISASYELIEWAAAIILGQGADEFLGTQGDPWDTQSDMLFALIGASTALLTLSRVHNREIAKVQEAGL